MKVKKNNEFEKSLIGLNRKYKSEIICNWVIEEYIEIMNKNKLEFEDLKLLYVLDFLFSSAKEIRKDKIQLTNKDYEIKEGAKNAINRFEKIIKLGKDIVNKEGDK